MRVGEIVEIRSVKVLNVSVNERWEVRGNEMRGSEGKIEKMRGRSMGSERK